MFGLDLYSVKSLEKTCCINRHFEFKQYGCFAFTAHHYYADVVETTWLHDSKGAGQNRSFSAATNSTDSCESKTFCRDYIQNFEL